MDATPPPSLGQDITLWPRKSKAEPCSHTWSNGLGPGRAFLPSRSPLGDNLPRLCLTAGPRTSSWTDGALAQCQCQCQDTWEGRGPFFSLGQRGQPSREGTGPAEQGTVPGRGLCHPVALEAGMSTPLPLPTGTGSSTPKLRHPNQAGLPSYLLLLLAP